MDTQNQQVPTSGNNKKTLWTILAIVVIFIYIVYMFNKYGSDNSFPTTTQSPMQPAIQQTKMVFDVPALIGKSYTQLKTELGNPDEEFKPNDKQKNNGTTSYDANWKKSDIELMISYFDANKPINYMFIGNNSGNSLNQEQLVKMSNLENSKDFKIIPQKAIIDTKIITGLHICNKDYKGEQYILGSENCK